MPDETQTRRPNPNPEARPAHHPLLALAILGALATSACAAFRLGELTPPEGRQIVVAVTVHGNHQVSDADIAAGLATYEDNLAITGAKPLLDRSRLPTDARRIESYYAARGFFEARVVEYGVEPRDEENVEVIFVVEEGPPTRVSEIRFEGLVPPPAETPALVDPTPEDAALEDVARRLVRLVPLRVGAVWNSADHERAKAQIRAALVRHGFLYAEVLGDVFVVRETEEAVVRYQTVPGPQVRIRDVHVLGNQRIPAGRIARRIDLEKGEIVAAERLRETEENIYALRVFFGVRAEPRRESLQEKLAGQPATFATLRALVWEPTVDIEVTVQEMPIHEVVTGVGASIDSKRNEVYVRGGYENRDLFGGLRYFRAELRPAFIGLPSFIDPDAVMWPGGTASLLFRQPSFLEEYIDLSLRVGYELAVDLAYKSHTVAATPALSRRFFRYLTAAVAYNISYIDYFDVSGALQLPAAQTMGLAFRDSYRLAYLEEILTFDLRDSAFDPRSGVFLAARVAQAFEAVGSEFHYVRLLTEARGYVSPWSFFTIAAQVRYGQVFNAFGAETPLPARFMAGGPNDMRGFSANRMGPFVCSRGTDSAAGGDSSVSSIGCPGGRDMIGGNVLFEGSFELRFRLPASFGLVAFVDVGEVWTAMDTVDFATLNVAVGPGLRYDTPFGPIRLDVGVLLNEPLRGDYTVHIAIGQAF